MAQPAPLLAVLTMQVTADLAKLRAVRRATTNYNLTLQGLASVVNQDLQALRDTVDAIPAPSLTLADMNSWLLSPLLTLVLEQDPQTMKDTFANLDAHLQQAKLAAVIRDYARQLTMVYEDALKALSSYAVLKLAKTYLSELGRIDYRPDNYSRSLRIVSQVHGLVSVDPSLLDVYNNGPFRSFEYESAGFTYLTTVPDEFDQNVKVFLTYLATADDKLRGWRVLGGRGLQ